MEPSIAEILGPRPKPPKIIRVLWRMQGPSRVIVSRIERRLYPELVTVIERRWTAREFSRADGTIGLSEFVFTGTASR